MDRHHPLPPQIQNGRVAVIVGPSLDSSRETTVISATPNNIKEGRRIVVNDKLSTVERITLCASEFFGTGILVFLGCMGCVSGVAGSIPHLQISLTFGLAVMVSVQCFSHISGSHINPAVTAAAAVLGNIALLEVPIYLLGQFSGAIAAYGLLKLVTPGKHLEGKLNESTNVTSVGVCSPYINPEIGQFQAVLVEFSATLILILVCCAVWDHRNNTKHDSVAIRFGLTIAVLAMAAGPYTGSNMNPARSFAPALFNGDWDAHWVYWIGPLGAGIFGGLFYRLVFAKPPVPVHNDGIEVTPLNDKA